MNRYSIYQPEYIKKFQCIAGACKENCCKQNWTILISKQEYENYKALGENEGKEICDGIRVTQDEPFVACMIYADGKCYFLDDSGHCRLQLNYGHELLSNTCRAYPRRYCAVGSDTEAFLELSCEAVAEIVLFDQSVMKFEDAVIELEHPIALNCMLDANRYLQSESAMDVFWRLRTVSLIIAQSRQYRLQVRLVILGTYIQKANELLIAGRENEITELTDTFIDRLEAGFYDSLAGRAIGGIDLEPDFISSILGSMEKKMHPLFNKFAKEARAGHGFSPENGMAPENFFSDYQDAYERFFADKEYILENIVVNHIFSCGFPFNYNYEDSIMKNYRELLVKYNLIKFLLVGVSRHEEKYSKRRTIECVSAFSRAYDHHMGNTLKSK